MGTKAKKLGKMWCKRAMHSAVWFMSWFVVAPVQAEVPYILTPMPVIENENLKSDAANIAVSEIVQRIVTVLITKMEEEGDTTNAKEDLSYLIWVQLHTPDREEVFAFEATSDSLHLRNSAYVRFTIQNDGFLWMFRRENTDVPFRVHEIYLTHSQRRSTKLLWARESWKGELEGKRTVADSITREVNRLELDQDFKARNDSLFADFAKIWTTNDSISTKEQWERVHDAVIKIGGKILRAK